jgi:LPS-assembly protein
MGRINLIIFIVLLFLSHNSWAIPMLKKRAAPESPTVLKADVIDADEMTHNLIARGNVEANKGDATLYADQITYDKGDKKGEGMLRAIGNVRIKNVEMGNVKATSADIKDDFSAGKFFNSKMVFLDGSYLSSPEIERKTPQVTVLRKSTFSICPNPAIEKDNDLAGKKWDMLSIKSTRTTIDRENQNFKINNGIIRLYNFPILYTPYLKSAFPSKKRESGFLSASYKKSTNLGTGIITPYYFNIAPNMDVTTTPYVTITGGQFLVDNALRHITSYGEYKLAFEAANNSIKNSNDRAVVNRTKDPYRWSIIGAGAFDFTKNTGLDFDIYSFSDRNYGRDYHRVYKPYNLSKVNLDYIKGRDYYAIKAIRIQELENYQQASEAPLIFPSFDSHIETAPAFFKEKFSLTSNVTAIRRLDGLQYRRATLIPEVNVPFNIKGNLFNFGAKLQNDFYSLDNNGRALQQQNNFKSMEYNYKPEISFTWKLPLIKKNKSSSIVLEPIVSLVSSSYRKNYSFFPNEDGSSNELTVSNLFINDRIAGYDRNESGQRANYGVRSSLFNKYGEFGLTVGQSYYKTNHQQDVVIRGIGAASKSNLVGQAMYKAQEYFSIIYNFQLSESNYNNEINEVITTLAFEDFTLSSNYLLIQKNQYNPLKKEQLTLSFKGKVIKGWDIDFQMVKNLIENRIVQRSIILSRDGCCTIFSIAATENNQLSLVKQQRSFSFNLTFKNL